MESALGPRLLKSADFLPLEGRVQEMTGGRAGAGVEFRMRRSMTLRTGPRYGRTRACVALLGVVLGGCADADRKGSSTDRVDITMEALSNASLTVIPGAVSIPATVQRQFVAVLTNGGHPSLPSGVVWSISDPSVASIDSNGLVTAKGPGPVTTTVTAAYRSLTAAARLTITAATLTSISVTPAARSIHIGTHARLAATGTFTGGRRFALGSDITWASRDTSRATVDSTGRVTGVSAGVATITATDNATGIYGEAVIKVDEAAVKSLLVSPPTASVGVGSTTPFTVTATFSDKSTQNVTEDATWSSTGGATVSNAATNAGVATGISVGQAIVSASLEGSSGTATLTIDDPTITLSGLTFRATQGIPFSSPVATFKDSDDLETPSTFTAQVDWGDGSPSTTGTITEPGAGTGNFVVSGQHTYTQPGPLFTVTVTLSAPAHTTTTGSFTATSQVVVQPELSVLPTATGAMVGVPLTTSVATLIDQNTTSDTASSFTITIDWGDGTTTAGAALQPAAGVPGEFDIVDASSPPHIYRGDGPLGPGPYTVTGTVSVVDNASSATASQTFTLTVGPELSLMPAATMATVGIPVNTPVATLSDGNTTSDTGSSFTIAIDWGDGTSTAGAALQPTAAPPGNFDIVDAALPPHIYRGDGLLGPGPYSVTGTVSVVYNATGATASQAFTLNVSPELSLESVPTRATIGIPVTAPVATLFDQNTASDNASSFTITIDWGDGTSTVGAAQEPFEAPPGEFDIVDASSPPHIYQDNGPLGPAPYTVTGTVSVVDKDSGATASQTFTMTVGSEVLLMAVATTATVGIPVTAPVATLSDGETDFDTELNFTITIDWGDGTSTAGVGLQQTGAPPGDLQIVDRSLPPHIYRGDGPLGPGPYTVTGTVSVVYNATGATESQTFTVTVSPELSLMPAATTATAGVPITGPIATLFDQNTSNDTVSSFSITIDWGDGTSTAGAAQQLGGVGSGEFGIVDASSPPHVYEASGPATSTVTVSVTDSLSGEVVSTQFMITVSGTGSSSDGATEQDAGTPEDTGTGGDAAASDGSAGTDGAPTGTGTGGTGGSGSGGAGGSSVCGPVTGSCNQPSEGVCFDYHYTGADVLSELQTSCTEGIGMTWSSSGCNKTGSSGGCQSINNYGCVVFWFYPPNNGLSTPYAVQQYCAEKNDGETYVSP
jgi:hypothetical protein